MTTPSSVTIAEIRCHVLADPELDVTATSSAQDTILVEVISEDGIVGWGETDLNPPIALAHIEAPGSHSMALGLREMLLGENALEVERLWEKLYVGSAMTGRRGAGVNAIGALDLALHDLRGKALGMPVWRSLGEPVRSEVRPYASLQPDTSDVEQYGALLIEQALAAQGRGFRAAKASLTFAGPYAHKGMRCSWAQATEMLGALRAAVGVDFDLMVDLQYSFSDVDDCLEVVRSWREFDLYFVETPLWADDLNGYARLAREQDTPIAAGEWLTTRHEFRQLIDDGRIAVAQPDIGRVGGLTEAVRVADLARARGCTVIPHLWKTGVSIAAALHFATVTEICPYVEFLPAEDSDSAIRRELTEDFELVEGAIAVPSAPGLGVEPKPAAIDRFSGSQVGSQA